MRTAFKEWAVIADALGSGRQIVILRKGGISEGREGFKIDHPEFLLFPTLFHQQRNSVIPEAQTRYDQIESRFPPLDVLRLEYVCQVAAWRKLVDLPAANRLQSQHVWRPEVIAERFDWGKNKEIYALAVRVSRLPRKFDLPMLPSYGGCKSWIEVDQDIDTSGSIPVLSDDEFRGKLRDFEAALT